ncbi:MAG: DUF1302 family protein [Bacteroidales bacterium]|nr:DUF1302 family protein [Bacteroidales bacterium]
MRTGLIHIYLSTVLLFVTLLLNAQEGNSSISAKGYLSSMQSAVFEEFDGDWAMDNLVHNRVNLSIYAGSKITFGLEMRNRIYTGDMLRSDPDYSMRMGTDNGWMDLSWNLIDQQSVLLNTSLDRFWVDFSGEKYQLRIGRQRINWGQTIVWNPNDVFNAYSYFDFDYIERPGSDALRLQIYPSYSSSLELAAKIDANDNVTAAALYRFNKLGYDFQFLGGYISGSDWMIGTGWSGAFGSTSFRGEISWFQPDENFADTTGTGIFTLGFDRSFANSGAVQFQAMYCNSPQDLTDFESLYSRNLSAKDLAFSKFSLFASAQVPVTQLFRLGASAIIYPDIKGFFAGPTIDASLSDNVDLSFFWQYFNAKPSGNKIELHLMFLRFKYSF